jgi:hypothetical protein
LPISVAFSISLALNDKMALDDRKEAVQLPLEKDTNLIAKDKSGQAALHSAVFALRKEVMQLLLEKSADVTAKDDSGRMVLHYQCWASDTQNPGTTWVPYLPRPVRYLPDLLQKSRYLPGRFYSGTQVPEHFDHVHYFSLYLIESKM